jgi:hypothetical protein
MISILTANANYLDLADPAGALGLYPTYEGSSQIRVDLRSKGGGLKRLLGGAAEAAIFPTPAGLAIRA